MVPRAKKKKKKTLTKKEHERAKKKKRRYDAKRRLERNVEEAANLLKSSLSVRVGRRKVTAKAIAKAVEAKARVPAHPEAVRRLMVQKGLRGLRQPKAPFRVKNEPAGHPSHGVRSSQNWG